MKSSRPSGRDYSVNMCNTIVKPSNMWSSWNEYIVKAHGLMLTCICKDVSSLNRAGFLHSVSYAHAMNAHAMNALGTPLLSLPV